jgi:hypothetical protein
MNPSTFRSTLATALAARSGLTAIGAKVWRYPPGKMATTVPTIVFGQVQNVDQSDFTLVGDTQRIYTLQGGGYAPSAGATDAQWSTAESNAYTLIDEITQELERDETVGGTCNHSRLTTWSLAPSTDESGRVFAEIEFTITIWVWP